MTATALLEPLPDAEDPNVVWVAMLTPSRAVDLFLEDLGRNSRSRKGRTANDYRRILDKFTDQLGQIDVTQISSEDCRTFLNGLGRLAINTQATYHAYLNSFLTWLYQGQRIKKNPLDHLPRPRRINPQDLDVLTVDNADVPKLLDAAESWTEILAVAIPAYLGPRRAAVAALRRRDYNQATGMLKFREKGGKTIDKPVPYELKLYLDAAIGLELYASPEDYLVPSEGPRLLTERDDRVIWRAVKRVAERAGVDAHVHALRAAFATFYLESHTGDVEGLQELMGHSSIATTQTYLRKLDRRQAMERVRDLSWNSVASVANIGGLLPPQFAGKTLASAFGVGAGGFEPPFDESLGPEPPGAEPRPTEVEK